MSDIDKSLNGTGLTQVNEIIGERLNKKQDTLTGLPGQAVGFDNMRVACAVQGWSDQNLLDNAYFPDPINQRAVSGTITEPGYFLTAGSWSQAA